MSIYKTGSGDELINPLNYSVEIDNFLKEESLLIEKYARDFDSIIEAGCMHGLHCEQIVSMRKRYIGVDIVERYILDARSSHKYKRSADFICSDILDVGQLITKYKIKNPLLIFPFNCFGNLTEAETVFRTLLSLRLSFLIFTYGNDALTESVRREYYIKSGFPDIKTKKTDDYVCFFDKSGLNTKAYSENWFAKLLGENAPNFFREKFSGIGVLYGFIPPKKGLENK